MKTLENNQKQDMSYRVSNPTTPLINIENRVPLSTGTFDKFKQSLPPSPTKLLPELPILSASPKLHLHGGVVTACPSKPQFSDRVAYRTVGSTSISMHDHAALSARTKEKLEYDPPDNLPPIAFLREPTPPREKSSKLGSRVDASLKTHQSRARIEAPPPSRAAFTAPLDGRNPSRSPASQSLPAAHPEENGTDSMVDEPALRYGYNSLIRRPAAHSLPEEPRADPFPARQRTLEAAYETAPAGIGTLRGPPALGLRGIAELVAREQSGKEKDANGVGDLRSWIQPRDNRAPTVAYVALLQDTFGPGNVLRGEGTKPARRRRSKGSTQAGRWRSASTTTGRSASTSEAMDVDREDTSSVDITVDDHRAVSWIADIDYVVKGKRTLVREDFASLAATMREIANMDVEEGYALGETGSRLRKSIWQLAQLEDIPFRDEFQLRKLARRLLKHWPTT